MAERLIAAGLLLVALWPFVPPLARRVGGAAGGRYPAMVRSSWLRFGLTATLLLAMKGRLAALWRLPPEFLPAQVWLGVERLGVLDHRYLIRAGAVGVTAGIAGGVLLTAWRAWRGRPEGTLFGDASSVRPAGPHEFGWGAAIAVTAGITEEVYFRLLLPLLIAQASGSALAGFGVAALLFGAAHRYQGWRGVAATAVVGAALSGFYLATASLAAAMAIHAAGDLGHLVIRPAVRGWIERRR